MEKKTSSICLFLLYNYVFGKNFNNFLLKKETLKIDDAKEI